MHHIHNLYLEIMESACKNKPYTDTVPAENIDELSKLAKKHFTAPFLFPYVSGDGQKALAYQTKMMMFHYYQLEHFTQMTIKILEAGNVRCFLLKGISLAAFYPQAEYRKLGDVDIYVPGEKACLKAQKLLEAGGYKLHSEVNDHHLTYSYTFPKTGRTYIAELHFRIVGKYQYEPANQIVDTVFSAGALSDDFQIIHGVRYRVLPPTEYVFYMIHHMLKHYLYSGFGIRLLCDFTLFISECRTDIDFSKIHTWCRKSRIMHLYEIVLESCRLWLGLPPDIDPDIHYSKKDCELFMEKILSDSDTGTDRTRMLVSSSSYKRIHILTYFKEGHLQMHVRFPRLGRCPLLWPLLWGVTFICFLRNTYRLRRTTLRQTLKDFNANNRQTQIIRVFDNTEKD